MADIRSFDKNMDFINRTEEGMDWYSADAPGIEFDGLYWHKPGSAFRRIPADASVSPGVDYLAFHTAGVMARFCTDAREIRIRASFPPDECRMGHMTCTGVLGFDLYMGPPGAKTFVKTTRFNYSENQYNVTIFGPEKESAMREFTLHFPLYAHPDKVEIGLTQGAKLQKPAPWKDPRPVVVYGTSIQQGGCATRPGMSHTNIMSRMLNRPFLDLAFSGSGKGEPAIAEIIAGIENPAMLILDYDANAHADGLRNTLSNFIDILRKKHPLVPILLVSRLPFAEEFKTKYQYTNERLELTLIHLEELKKRRESGDENIHFLDGMTLYGPEPWECTVDGVHATDLGFSRIAHNMAPVIENIITRQ